MAECSGNYWEKRDKENKFNSTIIGDENFEGPVTDRKCTNLLLLTTFILFNIGLIMFAIYSVMEGDAQRVLHGSDFRGELCGVDDLSGKEYLYWPDPNGDMDVKLCLAGCPVNTSSKAVCFYDIDHETSTNVCWDSYPSKPFNRQCLPASEDTREDVDEFLFEDVEEVVRRIGNDVYRAWDLIGIGCAVAFAFSLIFLIFFRFPSTLPMVISISAFLVLCIFGALAYMLIKEKDRIHDLLYDDWEGVEMDEPNSDMDTEVYVYISYGLIGIAALVLLAIVCLIPSLSRSVHILRLSSRPLKNIPSLLIFPLVEVLLGAFMICFMFTVCLYTISIGDIEKHDTDVLELFPVGGEVKVIDFQPVTRYLMIFVIPMSLWWLSFLSMVGEYVVSSAAAVWFFSKDKETLDSPILLSLKNLFYYHLGSVLWAAIIIPPTRMMKSIFGAIKGVAQSSNCCGRFTSGCCLPCLACHEHSIKYLSDDILPFMAIWGDSFGPSSKKVYYLKQRSGQNIKKMTTAGNFMVWVSQMTIALAGPTFVLYWIIYQDHSLYGENLDHITSALSPVVFTLIGSAFISQVLGGVFRGCINASVVCFIADREMFIEN